MEKNKLYKVNKWNKPAFMKEENVYWPGGEVQLTAPRISPYVDWSNPFQRAAAIGTSAGLVNGFSSIANTTNPFNNSGTATAQPTKGSALTGILGVVGGTAGNMLGSAIGGGYSTGGVGEGVAGVGNTIGGLVSTVNPLVGTAIQFGSGLIGGVINRGWGVKENKENIEAIKQNTANARMMGDALAGAIDSKGFFDTAGEMTTGSGFSAGDLYKDGWFTSKGTRQGNALINKENNALAFQRHGMVTGAENVDSIMDDNVFSNFAAFGGYVPTGMGAIDYGFMNDWLTGLNKRRKQASDNREANDYTNIGMGMRYDFGGDMQTNSADFSSGLVHIDAGGTHEESPYDGVQMGVDPEGTPNLVEEGEVIWNDYVFSNRIELDEEAKKIFHFPKKTKLTYADAAKRLEKEISERPNDPISKSAFKVQMEKLEEQQERQKQEMEAERVKAAFEALSPEEQVAVMENTAQQEQMAQEQAMAAEQASMPGTEPMMAEGQAGVPSQEEMAMMQQQGQPEVVEGQPVMAEGGHLFPWGGLKEMFNIAPPYAASRLAGHIPYIQDSKQQFYNEADVLKEEATPKFQAWTKYVNDNWDTDEVQAYLRDLDKAAGGNHLFGVDGKILPGAKDYFNKARTQDHKWGYYHLTPTPTDLMAELGVSSEDLDKSIMDSVAAVESQINGPRVFHAMDGDDYDGYIEGELDPAVVGAETRRETLPNGDTVIYHGKPTGNAADAAGNDNDKKIVPNLRPTWMRYAGLLGPAVGLGLMAAGVGRPDTSVFDNVLEGYDRRGIGQMEPRYIGNYLRYSPMDIWFEQNRLNANSRATDRSIANSGANQGSKIAGMLANAYNNQIASGDLYRKALEYNDTKRHQVADFNRATDMFNAQAYNQAQQFNASARNADRGLRAQLGMQAAAQKADMDAGWYNSLYGNIGALTRGIADIGRENYNHNMIARLAASGTLPGIVPENAMNADLVRYGAHGGKLKKKKKRGLTY